MTNELEAQYRRLAGWYPSTWRAAHEDVLVGTLLDAADADGRIEPVRAERWDLARGGLGQRLRLVAPRHVRDALAASSLGLGGAFALVYFSFIAWAPFLPNRAVYLAEAGFGPFLSTGVLTAVAFAILFTLACTRWRRATQIAALATVVTAVATVAAGRMTADPASAAATNMAFFALLAGVSLIGTPRPLRTVLLTAAAWVIVLIGGLALNDLLLGLGDRALWKVVANPYSVPAAAALALLVAVVLLAAGRPVASAVGAAGTLPWLAVTVLHALDVSSPEPLSIFLHAACALVALALGSFAVRRATDQRRTPTTATIT